MEHFWVCETIIDHPCFENANLDPRKRPLVSPKINWGQTFEEIVFPFLNFPGLDELLLVDRSLHYGPISNTQLLMVYSSVFVR